MTAPPEGEAPAPVARDVAVAGARWRVHAWPGEGRAVLAVHGFTGSGLDFAPLAGRLPGRLVAPDLPGHGASDLPAGPEACAVPALAAGLAALAAAEGPPVDVLGYSMGGRVALQLALDHPALVRALVLVGATPGLADPAARAARVRDDEALADALEARGVAWFAARWARSPTIRSQARIPEPWRAAMRARRLANRAAGLAAALRGGGTGAMAPLWDRLAGLDRPVLLVTGEEDARFGALATEMAARLPRARCAVVPGAGHCAHLERPREAAAAIAAFLDAPG